MQQTYAELAQAPAGAGTAALRRRAAARRPHPYLRTGGRGGSSMNEQTTTPRPQEPT
ncbi:hypothetical protein ACFWWM_30840 [Streptomyces sp. NPDC058682]|uniref:hypothetical protein n=1 Tax=Streptomyces sp. NPDC058682 TaxID=3346596 RepID=UPI0036599FB2